MAVLYYVRVENPHLSKPGSDGPPANLQRGISNAQAEQHGNLVRFFRGRPTGFSDVSTAMTWKLRVMGERVESGVPTPTHSKTATE
jgi:hypothetical protein